MRLVTFRHEGLQEIGALTEADSKIIVLQAAEKLRSGRLSLHLQSMLAFLQGGSAAREAASQAMEFAPSQKPEGNLRARTQVELLSSGRRPELNRDFMAIEQHVINCTRR